MTAHTETETDTHPNTHAILLFAHGARDPAWARPFEAIAQSMRQAAPQRPVALAYLELMQPSLETAAAELCAQGCQHITVVPLFLGAGGHVRRDLPERLAQLRQQHPEISVHATAAIGEIPAITQAIAAVALDLCTATPTPAP